MRRIRRPTAASAVGIVVLVLVAGAMPLAFLDHRTQPELIATNWVVGLAFLAVGVLVAQRRPELAMGWLMLGVAALQALSELGVLYSVLDYRRHHGRLPLGSLAVVIEPLWLPAFVLLVFTIVLYPAGALPSPRWRWPMRWLAAVTLALWVAACGLIAHTLIAGTVRIEAGGDLYQIDHTTGAWKIVSLLEVLGLVTLVLIVGAWLIRQLTTYRRLTGEARVQQKWIISGAVISILAVATNVLPYPFSSATGQLSVSDFVSFALAALPVAIGVGILRYRLYEIDRIVSRTLAYAILTAMLAATFIGLVLLSTRVLPFSNEVGVAASTLAAAALCNPLRARVQRAVDRRFNRARYDADATVAAFAARLRDALDSDAVELDLLATIKRSIEPSHASIWMRGRV
jgi:hypothetical protein